MISTLATILMSILYLILSIESFKQMINTIRESQECLEEKYKVSIEKNKRIFDFKNGEILILKESGKETIIEPDNKSYKIAIAFLEFYLIFISPIIAFALLIPVFILIKSIAIPLIMQISIAMIIVLFSIFYPAHYFLNFSNGTSTQLIEYIEKSKKIKVFNFMFKTICFQIGFIMSLKLLEIF